MLFQNLSKFAIFSKIKLKLREKIDIIITPVITTVSQFFSCELQLSIATHTTIRDNWWRRHCSAQRDYDTRLVSSTNRSTLNYVQMRADCRAVRIASISFPVPIDRWAADSFVWMIIPFPSQDVLSCPVVSCRAVSCRYVTDATCFTAVLPRLGFYHKNCSGIFLVWFLHIWGLIVILIKPYALFYYEHFSYRPTLCLKNVQSLTGYSFNIHTPIF